MSKTQPSTRKLNAWARLRAIATDTTDREAERLAAITEARDAGWSYSHIASALGVSPQAVHAFVHRRTNTRGDKQ